MESPTRLSLVGRMVLAIALLLLATGGFIGAVWAVFVGVFLFFRVTLSTATTLSIVPTGVLLLAIVALECRGVRAIERAARAESVGVDEFPELHATVTRVASTFDVPAPTVAISDSPAPEAMVVGVRPAKSRLILSTGTLAALDEDELEAVIAHELAHVRNRDATVMTVVSVPTVLAAGIVVRSPELAKRDLSIAVLLGLVGLAGVVATRSIVSVLSRTRELAADRAAAESIGSAAPLASALRTLDRRIRELPSEDLRTVSSVSALSILPFESREESAPPLTHWDEGDVEPYLWSIREPLSRLVTALFRTHPPTEERLRLLAKFERERL